MGYYVCLPFELGLDFCGDLVHGAEALLTDPRKNGMVASGYPVECFCKREKIKLEPHQQKCWQYHLRGEMNADKFCWICGAPAEIVQRFTV